MIVSLLKLRKQLQPYIVELFNASTHFGDPIMRWRMTSRTIRTHCSELQPISTCSSHLTS
jgi:alpha-glucosidase (family GH31 glycosyl hydrolase)